MPRYIDADELKNKLISSCAVGDFGQYLIDIQPTADVRPERHGRWEAYGGTIVPDENGDFCFNRTYVCSECGWSCNCEHEMGFVYCPYCGAKMGGESDE